MEDVQIRGSSQIKDKSITLNKLDEEIFGNNNLFIDNEDHSSECNGTKKDFVANYEIVPGSEHIYLRGLLRKNADEYTIGGDNKTITFVDAPFAGDTLIFTYRKAI